MQEQSETNIEVTLYISADTFAKMWVLGKDKGVDVAKHDKPIKALKFCGGSLNMLATASWDKTLKYWDLRQKKPAAKLLLPERCYSMDVNKDLMVVGCANKHVHVYDLKKPQKPFKTSTSTLKNQIRCIKCFPDRTGYATGSEAGRVAITYLNKSDEKKNFMFKCHRHEGKVYAVNAIDFHPRGTFATAGSDGQYVFWDKDTKQRLKKFEPRHQTPISCCGFNGNGSIFAYAVSYDWSKGMHHYRNRRNIIYLHSVKPIEVAPQPQGR